VLPGLLENVPEAQSVALVAAMLTDKPFAVVYRPAGAKEQLKFPAEE